MFYHDGDFFRLGIAVCNYQTHDSSVTIDVALRVEDEIAQSIVDWLTTIVLHRLSRMRMVTHQTVGSRIYQLVGIVALARYHLHVVFPTPM